MIHARFFGALAPLSLFGLAFALPGCDAPPNEETPPAVEARGDLLSSEQLLTLSREELQDIVTELGLPAIVEPHNGISFHRIVYRTVDVDGSLTAASGMVIVPDGEGPFPVLSDQHGTQVTRRPTITDPFTETETGGVALLFAGQGWLGGGADYLGLGVSRGLHHYYHAETEASASLDFLRSLHHFTAERDIPVTDELFLSGYSQGAHVTMALHRALEQEPVGDWTVRASAPMAGAFDLADLSLPAALTAPAPTSSLYVTYALLAYDHVYDIFDAPGELFLPPHDGQVEALFDGKHEVQEIVAALPPTPAELLQPSFVASFLEDKDHPLRVLLRMNDVLDWTPRAPITLYHGKADVDVPFANAERAFAALKARGAAVELVNVGDELDHATASMPSYFAARTWFQQLRAAP